MTTITTPAGTYGLIVEPWGAEEYLAVAANWAQAADPVRYWDGDQWQHWGYQVAEFRHDPKAALARLVRDTIRDGGDTPDEGTVAKIVAAAERIDDCE